MTDAEYQKLLADERTKVATAAAGLPKGSGTVYLAAEGGERMKQGVRSMFGMEEPVVTAHKKQEARQELLNSILAQFTNMETRADYIGAINKLYASGFIEEANKVASMLKDIPEDEETDFQKNYNSV